jgi:hypothetical protein
VPTYVRIASEWVQMQNGQDDAALNIQADTGLFY